MTKKIFDNSRSASIILLFALAMGLLIAFYPLLITPFAVGDDYVYIWQIGNLGQSADIFSKVVGEGRLIYALLVVRLYGLFVSLDDLQPARMVLFGLSVIAALVIYARIGQLLFDDVRSDFLRGVGAASLALCLMVMPGFQVLNSLVEALPFPLAILLALLARALLKRFDSGHQRTAMILSMAGAIVALVCALAIYQPLAMIFWIPAAIDLCDARKTPRDRLYAFSKTLFVGVIALGLAFFLLQATKGLADGRAALVVDIPAKLRWFFGELLPNALAMPLLQPSRRVAAAILIFILLGLIWRCKRRMREVVLSFAAFILCVMLCGLPNLVAAENAASYRSQAALEMAFAAFFALSARGWVDLIVPRQASANAIFCALAMVLVSAVCVVICNRQIDGLIARPQAYELAYLRASIAEKKQEIRSARKLTMISARRSDGIASRHLYDEFGVPSSFQARYADAMARLVLKENGFQNGEVVVVALPSTAPAEFAEDGPYIDMRRMTVSK